VTGPDGQVRVAVNATILDEEPTGLGVYSAAMIRALAGAGARPEVFTASAAALGGIPVRRVTGLVRPSRGGMGHLARIAWSQAVFPARAKLAGAGVALALTPTEGAVVPLLPQVTIVHDLLPVRFPGEYPRLGRFFSVVLPRILRRSAAVVAVSEATKHDCVEFMRLDPARITVVGEGCDGAFTPAGREASVEEMRREHGIEGYFLYVGSLLPHKNVGGLIEAFALAAASVKGPLVVAGGRDERFLPALRATSVALGISDRVRFLDYVSRDRLPALYRAADAFVFPSLCEGFGLPVLEAMASGIPVVTSRSSALSEVAGDAASLVDPHDTRAIADAMGRIGADRAWRDGMVARGLERARSFSWERAARDLLAVLERAAGAG